MSSASQSKNIFSARAQNVTWITAAPETPFYPLTIAAV